MVHGTGLVPDETQSRCRTRVALLVVSVCVRFVSGCVGLRPFGILGAVCDRPHPPGKVNDALKYGRWQAT